MMSYITSRVSEMQRYLSDEFVPYSSRTLCIDLFYSLCLESPGLGKRLETRI